jgi:hypothetical protein
VVDYPEYYGEIADAYYERKLWSEAMEVYLDMSECEEVISDLPRFNPQADPGDVTDQCACCLDQDCAMPATAW